MPNKGIYAKNNDSQNIIGSTIDYFSRDYIKKFFSEIYFQDGENRYKKIATIRLIRFMRFSASTDLNGLRFLLNKLIECPVIYNNGNSNIKTVQSLKKYNWVKDTIAYDFCRDTTHYTFDQINITPKNRWAQIPVIKADLLNDGIFKDFEDFKEVKTIPTNVSLIFSEKDSFYRMNSYDSSKFIEAKMPWGLCIAGCAYMRFGKNVFLKLYKQDNTFKFYIPCSLPDIYTVLCILENYQLIGTVTTATGNIIADLGTAFMTSIVNMIIKNANAKKIKNESIKHDIRHCIIDMESGDILF